MNVLLDFMKLTMVVSGLLTSMLMSLMIARSAFCKDYSANDPFVKHALSFLAVFAASAFAYVVFS